MTQDFNLKRARLLTKSIFLINKKNIIWGTTICFGVMLICSTLAICINNGANYSFISPFFCIGLIPFSTMLLVAYMFLKYSKQTYVNTTYMVPASTNEKFLVIFITSLILLPIVLFLLYIIALSLAWIISLTIYSGTGAYLDIVFDKNTLYFGSPITYLSSLIYFHSVGCIISNSKNKLFMLFYITIMLCGFFVEYALYDYPGFREKYNLFKCSMQYILTAVFWTASYINFKRIQTTK